MWEAFSITLSCLGFAAAVALVFFELPATLEQLRARPGNHHHHQF